MTIKTNVDCDYCGRPARLVSGEVIYPHRPDLFNKRFWLCKPCGAYVGCHPGTIASLGRLANATLRKAKSRAHRAFDPLWRDGEMLRHEAYKWLAESLSISGDECHIGMFDETLCEKVIEACKERVTA